MYWNLIYKKIVTILVIFCRKDVFQNNSQCLLLNDSNKFGTRYCSVFHTKYKHKKMNTQELKKGKFKEKIRELGWAFFNIYLVNLHFCWCQEKIPLEKSPPWGVRGRVSVRLGIELGLGSGGAFFRGIFAKNHFCYNQHKNLQAEVLFSFSSFIWKNFSRSCVLRFPLLPFWIGSFTKFHL